MLALARRSEEMLREQTRTIRRFLRDRFTAEDAAATASPGYAYGIVPPRDAPHGWTPGYRSQYAEPKDACCSLCSGPAAEHSNAWEEDIARLHDRYPLGLREGVRRALPTLDWLDRMAVELCVVNGLSYREAARRLRLPDGHDPSHMMVFRHERAALERLAELVYDEMGAYRYGE